MRAIRLPIFAALLAAAGLLIVTVSAGRLSAARQRGQAAMTSLKALHVQADELLRLRSQREVIAWKPRPTADVLALVNAALMDAGVPTARLKGIGEGGDAPLSGAGENQPPLRRQSLVISLEGLTPAQIGLFLAQWERAAEQWSAERLEITHRRDPTQADLYDLRLHISAVYLSGA